MKAKNILAGGLLAGVSLALLIAPARAGGGTWGFEGQRGLSQPVLVPGEPVRAMAAIWLKGVGSRKQKEAYWAGPEHGPFYGYIAKRDGSDWGPYPPPLPKDALLVGEVAFTKTDDPGVMDVTLDFVMPDLEPGFYSLLHCNDPCTRQIGDTMSTPIVVAGNGQAFIARRVQRLDQDVRNLGGRLRRLDDFRPLTRRLESRIEAMETEIESLEQAAAAPQRSSAPSSQPSPWGLGAAMGAAGLFVAAAWSRSRRNRHRSSGAVNLPLPTNPSR